MKASYLTLGAVALTIGLVSNIGCSVETIEGDTGGAGGSGGAGGMQVGPGPGPGPGPGAGGGGAGDGNDSFAEAVNLPLGMDVLDNLDPVGTDSDYFSMTLSAGDLLTIDSAAKPENDPFNPAYPDLVLSLYDSGENKVAENDDPYLVRDTNDSRLWYRVPADGTYYLRVTDCINWEDGGPDNCSPAADITETQYGIRATVLDPAEQGTIVDSEGGSDIASANDFTPEYTPQGMPGTYFASVAYGTFTDNSDIDVYKIHLPDDISVEGDLFGAIFIQGLAGPSGIGTTANLGQAWMTMSDGTTVLSRIDHSVGVGLGMPSRDLRAPMAADTDYYLFVQHPGGPAGANDFYIFNHNGTGSNELEDDTANDAAGLGQVLTPVANGDLTSAFISGDVLDGDTDRFSFAVPNGFTGTVSVACGAVRSGSGLILDVAVKDEAGAALATPVTESEAADLIITDIDPGTASSIVIELTQGGTQSDVITRFYQCGFHQVPPAP